MNTNTKRLFFTVLILGTLLSIVTATTIKASANDVLTSQRQRDQDRERLCQNDKTCVDVTEGFSARHQRQHGPICLEGSNSELKSDQTQNRYQHRHCHGQGN